MDAVERSDMRLHEVHQHRIYGGAEASGYTARLEYRIDPTNRVDVAIFHGDRIVVVVEIKLDLRGHLMAKATAQAARYAQAAGCPAWLFAPMAGPHRVLPSGVHTGGLHALFWWLREAARDRAWPAVAS